METIAWTPHLTEMVGNKLCCPLRGRAQLKIHISVPNCSTGEGCRRTWSGFPSHSLCQGTIWYAVAAGAVRAELYQWQPDSPVCQVSENTTFERSVVWHLSFTGSSNQTQRSVRDSLSLSEPHLAGNLNQSQLRFRPYQP